MMTVIFCRLLGIAALVFWLSPVALGLIDGWSWLMTGHQLSITIWGGEQAFTVFVWTLMLALPCIFMAAWACDAADKARSKMSGG